jgi:phosphoribosyl-AMP cyclohydrolase
MPAPELQWIKASSSMDVDACVEMAADGDLIAVRHSKKQDVLIHYSRAEFTAFLKGAKSGEFDYLLGPDTA